MRRGRYRKWAKIDSHKNQRQRFEYTSKHGAHCFMICQCMMLNRVIKDGVIQAKFEKGEGKGKEYSYQSIKLSPQFSQVAYQTEAYLSLIAKVPNEIKSNHVCMASGKQCLIHMSILSHQLVQAIGMDGVKASYPFVLLVFKQRG